MTSEAMALADRLAAGETIVLDGGMGTELEAAGVPMDPKAWAAPATLKAPDVVREVHERFIRAGADVIIANSFPAGRLPLIAAGFDGRFEEANRRAVEIAREARDRAERPVVVAGAMGSPTAKTQRCVDTDDGSLRGYDESLEDYRVQAAALADAGADLLAIEMVYGTGYGTAAIEAALDTGLPIWLGLSPGFSRDGEIDPTLSPEERAHRTGTGEPFVELLDNLLRPELAAVSLMHVAFDVIVPALALVRERWDGPVGVYPESGRWIRPQWEFTDMTPDEFAEEAKRWVAAGAQILGGCCGVRPDHIAALDRARERGEL